jgi:glycosyltransferase involved in cell wall biosynthesis
LRVSPLGCSALAITCAFVARAASGDPPSISVVLPVRNAAATIADQLRSLAAQTMSSDWELLVVDNGCVDETLDVVARWAAQIPRIRIVDARDTPGLSHARNAGVAAARGEFVAFCDADDEVDAHWLRELSAATTDADLIAGHLEVDSLNDPDVVYWRGGSPTSEGLKMAYQYLGHAVGANFAIRRAAFLDVGGCDPQFRICSDDVDLSWRAQEAGYRIAFAPGAVVHYRFRPGVRDVVRQQWNYGRAEAALYRKFRPRMRRQSLVVVARTWWYLFTRLHQTVRGHRLRGRWMALAAYRTGRLRGSLDQHVLWW